MKYFFLLINILETAIMDRKNVINEKRSGSNQIEEKCSNIRITLDVKFGFEILIEFNPKKPTSYIRFHRKKAAEIHMRNINYKEGILFHRGESNRSPKPEEKWGPKIQRIIPSGIAFSKITELILSPSIKWGILVNHIQICSFYLHKEGIYFDIDVEKNEKEKIKTNSKQISKNICSTQLVLEKIFISDIAKIISEYSYEIPIIRS